VQGIEILRLVIVCREVDPRTIVVLPVDSDPDTVAFAVLELEPDRVIDIALVRLPVVQRPERLIVEGALEVGPVQRAGPSVHRIHRPPA